MSEGLGYEHEWLPDDEYTTDEALIGGMTCSQRKCHEPAVASFLRTVHHLSKGTTSSRRWYCCADPKHLYGRRIVDGVVEFPYMVGSNSWKRAKERTNS